MKHETIAMMQKKNAHKRSVVLHVVFHVLQSLVVAVFLIFFLNSIMVQAEVTCAPGDVPLDTEGKPVDTSKPGWEKTVESCLYGSDTAANKGFGETVTDIRVNIRIVVNVIMGFLGIIVVGMIFYGGYMWLTAMGSEDKVTKGKHTLMWAAIGAIIISVAWTIASYILHVGSVVG